MKHVKTITAPRPASTSPNPFFEMLGALKCTFSDSAASCGHTYAVHKAQSYGKTDVG